LNCLNIKHVIIIIFWTGSLMLRAGLEAGELVHCSAGLGATMELGRLGG
jgi:hypothetical protein